MERWLDETVKAIRGSLSKTSLRPLMPALEALTGGGKLLRARLIFRIGLNVGVEERTLVHAAASVELVHAASLVHDDVIDGSVIRRHAPAFWVENGAAGAILVGDMLFCEAMRLLDHIERPDLMPLLIRFTSEMCDAEAEQSLLQRGAIPTRENCLRLARRKTGSLFAFAARVAGGRDEPLCAALEEAGYALGTAYQLADDILDAFGDDAGSDKSLGLDARQRKVTAATAWAGDHAAVLGNIDALRARSAEALSAWPAVRAAWTDYVALDIQPCLDAFTSGLVAENTL
jgi:geranylgeranyl pyrophosphate synthase